MNKKSDLSPCCGVQVGKRSGLYYCPKCNSHLEKIYNPYIELIKEGKETFQTSVPGVMGQFFSGVRKQNNIKDEE